ncbi:hypothetical protein [Salinibacter phage 8_2]
MWSASGSWPPPRRREIARRTLVLPVSLSPRTTVTPSGSKASLRTPKTFSIRIFSTWICSESVMGVSRYSRE